MFTINLSIAETYGNKQARQWLPHLGGMMWMSVKMFTDEQIQAHLCKHTLQECCLQKPCYIS